MKNVLKILGLFIILTGIKAVSWVAKHGTPFSFRPNTTGDRIGFGFVILLLISFVSCLSWYLVKGDRK
jgi:hypothetical protein